MINLPSNDNLASERLISGRKTFFLDLKENHRGRFIKVTEDVSGHRDTILVPMEAIPEFLDSLQRLIETEAQMEEPATVGEDF